jgi:hypothetical protein
MRIQTECARNDFIDENEEEGKTKLRAGIRSETILTKANRGWAVRERFQSLSAGHRRGICDWIPLGTLFLSNQKRILGYKYSFLSYTALSFSPTES